MSEATLRAERGEDAAAVRALHRSAFPTAAEADLVDRLRADGDAVISLVAVAEGQVVGHVLFSRMTAPFPALALAPVAVASAWRRRGLAAGLIRAGLAEASARGWQAAFVVGEPAYYERFGFSAEAARGFASPYAGPFFMVAVIGDRLLATSGRVEHAPAFAALA